MHKNSPVAKEDDSNEAPFDLQFLQGTMNTHISTPHLQLPKIKDTLYLMKSIGDYEFFSPKEQVHFNPDPNQIIKFKLPAIAENNLIQR